MVPQPKQAMAVRRTAMLGKRNAKNRQHFTYVYIACLISAPVPQEAPDRWPLLIFALHPPKPLISIVNKTKNVIPFELQSSGWEFTRRASSETE
jgi:hypothetical protein